MKDILKEYIIKKYGIENFEEIIKKNYVNYIYAEETHNVKLLLNKANVMLLQNEVIKNCEKFKEQDINYILFKGVALANYLYKNVYIRCFGDIDIFVSPEHFEEALQVLYNEGYELRFPEVLLGNHHFALKKDRIIIELHKNILNPFTKIDETYLRDNLTILNISNQNITTFNITATLLHLIYHLYMDTYLASESLYHTFVNKTTPEANRFLYRAYEIALFSEKYYDEIKWEDIIQDIKKQKLRIIFKGMIMDILKIFPNAFPDKLIDTIYNLEYEDDDRDLLYKQIINADENDIDRVICDYVNDNWSARKDKNIKINIGESFELNKKRNEQIESKLSCKVDAAKNTKGVKFTFTILDDDIYFSDIDNYDTQSSDGVHLLLCGTEKYTYNSIFLFPKQIGNEIEVIACDVLNDINTVLDKNLIETSYERVKGGYIITAILSNEFLSKNHIYNYFYLGLVVSDCDSKEKRRINEIISSENDDEWFNPAYFTMIKL